MIIGDAVICDTGVYSRAGVGAEPYFSTIYSRIGPDNAFITPVIRIELYNWLSGYHSLTKSERNKILNQIKAFPIIHLTEEISKLAITLADKHINSKPGDTLIAATALYYDLPVYTLNKKDFQPLGVKLFIP